MASRTGGEVEDLADESELEGLAMDRPGKGVAEVEVSVLGEAPIRNHLTEAREPAARGEQVAKRRRVTAEGERVNRISDSRNVDVGGRSRHDAHGFRLRVDQLRGLGVRQGGALGDDHIHRSDVSLVGVDLVETARLSQRHDDGGDPQNDGKEGQDRPARARCRFAETENHGLRQSGARCQTAEPAAAVAPRGRSIGDNRRGLESARAKRRNHRRDGDDEERPSQREEVESE